MSSNKLPIVVCVILDTLLVISVGANIAQYLNQSKPVAAVVSPVSAVAKQIETYRFQAVFLTNGQAYFGRLSLVDNSDYKLTDVYYLSSDKPTTLVKLGNEVHKPEDAMIIPATQVLFIENLQNVGQFNGQLQ